MKVVVVEDQILFREFLIDSLQNKLGCEVVGTAIDGPGALDLISRLKPELVILDILIPEISGIVVARSLRKDFPRIRILALSNEMDAKTLHQVHQLRLNGFVDKNAASFEVLEEALTVIRAGGRFFSESMVRAVKELRADPEAFMKILSPREQEILTHIGGGLSDQEIGMRLGLSDTSVQSHRRNLLRKLNCHSTPQLIRFAQDKGFWKPSFEKMNLVENYHLHE